MYEQKAYKQCARKIIDYIFYQIQRYINFDTDLAFMRKI